MGALSSITILLPKKMRSNTNLCQIDSAVDFMTDSVSFALVREMTQLPNRNDIIPIQRAFPASLPRKRGNDLGKTQTWDLERNGAPQNRRELAELHDADNFPQYFTIQCGIQVSPFIINNCFILNLHKKCILVLFPKDKADFQNLFPLCPNLSPNLPP